MAAPAPSLDPLLRALAEAVDAAPRPVRSIEVGVALSIALGRERPAMSCGGCQTPLAFRGIPAETNIHLREPFRLRLEDA
jgi:hypothetical protein